MKNFILFLCLVVFLQPLGAQSTKVKPTDELQLVRQISGIKSDVWTTPLLKSIDHQGSDKWAISVRPTFSREHSSEKVKMIKESKRQDKINSYSPGEESDFSQRAVVPVINKNFEANWSIDGTPPDNSMAISNGGFVVTTNNDGIEYYNGSGTFLYFDFWSDFFNDNSLTASIYDPKVIYDSGADRFVLVLLHGSTANNSKVLVSFSKSNNPQDGWWVYTLTGNPLNNQAWFDYPSLGVSNNEIYITGNLFKGNSFNQAIIYQIQKAPGYAGNNLPWQNWSGLSSDPYEAFSLNVASYGHQGNYGPGVYLVSSESSGDNRMRLWDLTDDMDGAPQLFSYTINSDTYSPAADAFQKGTDNILDNGDCRIQNAFYLNGIIHYALNTDIGDGWGGISYNRLAVGTGSNTSTTFGLQGSYDYSYPAVVPFSTAVNDLSVMVAFLRTSEDIFPEVRVVNCDQNFNWSPSTLVKAGEAYVDFLGADKERWGDYTGIARRHNSPDGRIWLAGCYGANINSQNTTHTYKTWVAEVSAGDIVSSEEPEQEKNFSVFPNPTYDFFYLTFTPTARELTTISLYTMDGRLVKTLYQDSPKIGENKLTFNKGVLPSGTYLISITTSTKVLKNETIVILD